MVPPRTFPAASWSSVIAAIGLLNGSSSFGSISSSLSRSKRWSDVTAAASSSLVSMPSLLRSRWLNRASLRSIAKAADLDAERAEGGPEDVGQFFERNLAVLGVGVEVGAGKRRRTAGRGPHHHRQRAAVGLLLGQDAVSIAVEVSMDGFHRVEPGRPERLAPRIQPQPDENGPGRRSGT